MNDISKREEIEKILDMTLKEQCRTCKYKYSSQECDFCEDGDMYKEESDE